MLPVTRRAKLHFLSQLNAAVFSYVHTKEKQMPIEKPRHSCSFVFEKSRTTLLGVLIAASASLFPTPHMSTAEAAATNNWACTKIFGALHAGHTKSQATRRAWDKWREGAAYKCGAQCAFLKYAANKKVEFRGSDGRGYRVKVSARACYHQPGIGTMKSPGVGLRAPTRRP